MIRIINTGLTNGNDHTYELYINYTLIGTYTHNRSDGLSRCLENAARCAELNEIKNILNLMNSTGEKIQKITGVKL